MTGARTGVTSVTTPTDREIVVVRVVDAPRRMVFDAFSNPAHMPKWLLGPTGWTMPVCEIDLRPGGAWRYVWRKADGTEMVMVGTYREVVPPERIVWTESWGGPWPETVNTLALVESDGQTTITITMTYPSQEARDAALKTGIKEGMSHSYARLDQYLATLARP